MKDSLLFALSVTDEVRQKLEDGSHDTYSNPLLLCLPLLQN